MAKKAKSKDGPKDGAISVQRLKSFVERIEKLEEEKSAVATDIRDVYAEAHGVGYDKKAIRRVVRERAMDQGKRQQEAAVFDTYAHALGLQLDMFTPGSARS